MDGLFADRDKVKAAIARAANTTVKYVILAEGCFPFWCARLGDTYRVVAIVGKDAAKRFWENAEFDEDRQSYDVFPISGTRLEAVRIR